MEFLVAIEIDLPADLDSAEFDRLRSAEEKRAAVLAADGLLRRIWRVPGRRANWGLWQASDATELHAALESLPMWPWMEITVHPLAEHGNDPAEVA
jgi:muconolactone D-isomerase